MIFQMKSLLMDLKLKMDDSIVKFIKEYTIPSVNGKVNKKELCELFSLEYGIEKDLSFEKRNLMGL